MARAVLHVVTANLLADGDVVYLDPAGGWAPTLEAARIARTREEADALLVIAEAAVRARRVVAPYLIEVVETGGRIAPIRYRELIRARGPTVRPDLGKQAQRG